jgi:hypothetical protein
VSAPPPALSFSLEKIPEAKKCRKQLDVLFNWIKTMLFILNLIFLGLIHSQITV